MSSTDPLLALQDAIKRNEAITYLKDGAPVQSLKAATHVKLGSAAVMPKSTPTRWRRPTSDKEALAMDPSADPSKFFALDSIALTWNTRTEPAAVYMRQATTEVVIYVQLTDRRPVLDWLEGKIQNHDRLAPLSQGESVACRQVVLPLTAQPQTPQPRPKHRHPMLRHFLHQRFLQASQAVLPPRSSGREGANVRTSLMPPTWKL